MQPESSADRSLVRKRFVGHGAHLSRTARWHSTAYAAISWVTERHLS
jgi:hypothetical protein